MSRYCPSCGKPCSQFGCVCGWAAQQEHPPIYADEHGDWAAANRGAASRPPAPREGDGKKPFVRKECVCGHADSSHTVYPTGCRFCACSEFQLAASRPPEPAVPAESEHGTARILDVAKTLRVAALRCGSQFVTLAETLESVAASRPPEPAVPVGQESSDAKDHPIWRLTVRLDASIERIRDIDDMDYASDIASSMKWLTAEIRGHLAKAASRASGVSAELPRCTALMPSESTGGAIRECGAIVQSGRCFNGHDQASGVSAEGAQKFTVRDGDYVCEHGTAVDVHCCNCHSGFLFDSDSCVCTFGDKPMDYACEHHKGAPRENCLLCFTAHPVIAELRRVRAVNEQQPPSVHCTDVTIALGHAIEKIAALEASSSGVSEADEHKNCAPEHRTGDAPALPRREEDHHE